MDDQNMSLNVLKNGSRTCPILSFIENDSTRLAIFVQIIPYFNHK